MLQTRQLTAQETHDVINFVAGIIQEQKNELEYVRRFRPNAKPTTSSRLTKKLYNQLTQYKIEL
jgi:hypothetical protein